MGIFGALTTAVTGMRAQSFALENVSGNIANSQTTAFKRIDTSFEDLIPDDAVSHQVAGSVVANSRATNTVQGDMQTSSIGTFMAVNGDGFFVVQKPSNFADNRPVFDGVNNYTRRGDFQPDKNGFLVNGAGYYLMGIPIDPTTGNLVGSVPQLLQFQNDFLPAQPTTEIDYRANLASYPLTPSHDTNVPGSELLKPIDFIQNPIAGAVAAATITGSGASLNPDAKATATGTVAGLTGATTLASLGITNAQTLTVNDGTNTTTYTVVNAATETVANVITAIGGGSAAATASIVGGKASNRIQQLPRHTHRRWLGGGVSRLRHWQYRFHTVESVGPGDHSRTNAYGDGRRRLAAGHHLRHRRRTGLDVDPTRRAPLQAASVERHWQCINRRQWKHQPHRIVVDRQYRGRFQALRPRSRPAYSA